MNLGFWPHWPWDSITSPRSNKNPVLSQRSLLRSLHDIFVRSKGVNRENKYPLGISTISDYFDLGTPTKIKKNPTSSPRSDPRPSSIHKIQRTREATPGVTPGPWERPSTPPWRIVSRDHLSDNTIPVLLSSRYISRSYKLSMTGLDLWLPSNSLIHNALTVTVHDVGLSVSKK